MKAIDTMIAIWKQNIDRQTYAMKLYTKAGGTLKQSMQDVYIATDIKLLKECQQRAENKLNKELI